MLSAAAGLLAGTGGQVPPALVRAISDSRAPQTWNRYLGPLRAWSAFAEGRGSSWLPADPCVFAEFLVEHGAANAGYSQTKARICAISALSDVAGVQSPAAHPLVRAARGRSPPHQARGAQGPLAPHLRCGNPAASPTNATRGGGRRGRAQNPGP